MLDKRIAKSERGGFTLIEMIIYIAMTSVLLVGVVGFMWNILSTEVRVDASSETTQSGRFVLETLTQKIRGASDIFNTGSTIEDDSESDFNSGVYNKTQWNVINSWLELTSLGKSSGDGDFTSRTFDAGGVVAWNSLSWLPDQPYGKALPDNGASEIDYPIGNADMNGNVLLMHLDESSGQFQDTSGQGRDGVGAKIAYGASGIFGAAAEFSGGSGGSGIPVNISLKPSADAWFIKTPAANNYGAASSFYTYPREVLTGYTRRSVLRFDLSSIPVGATINSAKLTLRESGTYGYDRDLDLHRLTRSWTEGNNVVGSGVSWSTYDGTNKWSSSGGDFAGIRSDTARPHWPPLNDLVFNGAGLMGDVQNFVNGTAANSGWLLKDRKEDNSERWWSFYSREGSVPPKLDIEYSVSLPPSHIDLGAFNITGNEMTISTWFKADDFDNDDSHIISKASGPNQQDHYFTLSVDKQGANSRLHFQLKAGGSTESMTVNNPTLQAGVWYNAVARYDGNTMKLYLNGVEVGSNKKSGAIDSGGGVSVWLGDNPSGGYAFDGVIDEVAIWERALDLDEILSLYKRGVVNVNVQVRSGATNPPASPFVGPDGTTGTSYSEAQNASVSLPNFNLTNIADSRYFQYKLFFTTIDAAFSPEVHSVSVVSSGGASSTFDVHPGELILDYPDEDITFSTYTKNVSVGGKSITIRTLRMQEGSGTPIDLTNQRVNVTNFVLRDRQRDNERKNVEVELTLEHVTTGDDFDRENSINLNTAVSVRQ